MQGRATSHFVGWGSSLNPTYKADCVASTAPFGTKGKFVATTSETSVGPTGAQIKTTLSAASDANNLGVYQFGSLSGNPVTSGETFPGGFDKRSNIVWGVTERGDVTATLVFDYSQQPGVSDASKIEILKRTDANDTSWDLVTENSRDDAAKTITLTGVTSFSEYALGAGSDNSLPVTLTSFTATDSAGVVIVRWVVESERDRQRLVLSVPQHLPRRPIGPDAEDSRDPIEAGIGTGIGRGKGKERQNGLRPADTDKGEY